MAKVVRGSPESGRLQGTGVVVKVIGIEEIKDFPHERRRQALANLENLAEPDVGGVEVVPAAIVARLGRK